MIISVDHGNKSIKTPNALFTSGLISSEGLQGFKTDYICWNGRYYTLTEQRISYLRDKTEDERFYVLTLFAIAKELERRKAAETLDPIDITLLIGLPPAHYEQLHSRFEQYFLRRREAIDFEYNGKYYSIRISKVLSYPQAFAAAVTQYSTLKTYSVAYIIDIGGFTIDVLKLRNGRPDLAVVESFEKGVITLYNSITSKCNALYARISNAFAASSFARVSTLSSSLARTSLASWPMTGRSSALREPICLRTAVSSPFLPRYCTRSASRSSAFSAPPMASRALARMASNSCFISFLLLCRKFRTMAGGKKRAPPRPHGTKELFRGTTQIRADGLRALATL